MKIRENKGFTQADIIISVIIVTLFVTTIAALFSNLSTEKTKAMRKSEATNIAVTVIEKIKQIEYSKVDEDGNGKMTIDELNSILESDKVEIADGYEVDIQVVNYKDYEQNKNREDIEDVLKKVTVKVSYKLKAETQYITLETLISVG